MLVPENSTTTHMLVTYAYLHIVCKNMCTDMFSHACGELHRTSGYRGKRGSHSVCIQTQTGVKACSINVQKSSSVLFSRATLERTTSWALTLKHIYMLQSTSGGAIKVSFMRLPNKKWLFPMKLLQRKINVWLNALVLFVWTSFLVLFFSLVTME